MSDSSHSPQFFFAKIFYRVYLCEANGAIKFPRCFFVDSSTSPRVLSFYIISLSSSTKRLRSNNRLQPRRHQRFRILNVEDGGVFRLSRFLCLRRKFRTVRDVEVE